MGLRESGFTRFLIGESKKNIYLTTVDILGRRNISAGFIDGFEVGPKERE
jgi:hypothetical protein